MNRYALIRPLFFQFPEELAHNLALLALKYGLIPSANVITHSTLATELWGMTFKNPIGMAAGFDKNAEVISPLSRQGFGFVEVGSVTPKPQKGNPKPRIFRIVDEQAIINRLGFNNKGCDFFIKQLQKTVRSDVKIGVNIGKNKISDDAVADYMTLLDRLYDYSDYMVVNISSPNTPGLRGLQHDDAFVELLEALRRKHDELIARYDRKVPLLIKIDPDGKAKQRQVMAKRMLEYGIDGIIVSNTTVSRPSHLTPSYKEQKGGLSGVPLYQLSTQALKEMYYYTEGKIPLIGVGGVASAEDAYQKIRAGASLVQCYTAFIYQGFSLVNDMNRGLMSCLEKDGYDHVQQAVGVDVDGL